MKSIYIYSTSIFPFSTYTTYEAITKKKRTLGKDGVGRGDERARRRLGAVALEEDGSGG